MKEFETYTVDLIEMTFGFKPKIEVTTPKEGMIDIILSGTPVQRAEMMGTSGNNIKAIAALVRVFCRRQGYFVYLHLDNKHETDFTAPETDY